MRIAVVGLGYEGLPLALQFARSGVAVVGLDVDTEKVAALSRGESHIMHIPRAAVRDAMCAGSFCASTDFGLVEETEAVIICVPTLLSESREPDISFVLGTARAVAPHLARGSLVVLESTSCPGTTEGELRRTLEEASGMSAGRDFHLAFSSGRDDPANPLSRVASSFKVVSGYTPESLERAVALYSKAVEHVVAVGSCRVAETAKLLASTPCSVDIALVDELKVDYAAMGIDIWRVDEAAKTSHIGSMPYYHSPGLGGECIPSDPFYLAWTAGEFGTSTGFEEPAAQLNASKPEYVVNLASEALEERCKSLKGSRILVLGLFYRADVDDDSKSPSYVLVDLLRARGAVVGYYDPYLPIIKPSRRRADRTATRSVTWDRDTIRGFDLVIVATKHDCVDYRELSEWAECVVDTRNALA